jgi:N6-L-threonylcarbamoyladenine synthase
VVDLVASYQEAIVATLRIQTARAVERLRPRALLLVGGVACNSQLRSSFKETFEARGLPVFYPRPALTTDNAAMIAAAGAPKLAAGAALELDMNADPNLRLC